MFMFMSRKRGLIKKLLRRRRNDARQCGKATQEHCEQNSGIAMLLEKLQENQLDMLLTAIDSRGANLGNCILVSREIGGSSNNNCCYEPQVLCCQIWRWPDVRERNELKRLPMCRSAIDPVYICCNPYHWSRLCQPATPPPPYSRTNVDRIKPEDRAPSEVPLLTRTTCESLTTNGESSVNSSSSLGWCKLAYWQEKNRVGPFFPVESMAVNVFGEVGYGQDGLNLENLARANCQSSEAVSKTRSKIGLGVTLSREDQNRVWLYNRSDQSVFVNSLCLEGDSNPHSPRPTRVPADHCLCVYDPARVPPLHCGWNFVEPQTGPLDPRSIRISFVKGWGLGYSRRDISSCHCWLEILLAPCR